MTCSQCRYEFCWLCMGDYRQHQAETGKYLCNSFDDVVQLKRDNQSDMAEKQRIELIKRKLEHFQTRYMEHFKAVGFAKQKKSQIEAQIDEFTKLQSQYSTQDLEFLNETSELVIRARRAITYTYPLRYLMENNPAKKAYFDFIQGDLEFSLEKLVRLHERDWRNYIEPEIV